jgi:glycosyltransferase involved in cell wall biosynthesis
VVVMPSLEPEAFGRVAMEAQAMARPVIATNHGGAAETVLHHETGWLVTPGNVQELAGALLEATSLTREQFHEVGLRAMQHAAEHYDLTLMQQRTLAVYAELLGIELLEISL